MARDPLLPFFDGDERRTSLLSLGADECRFAVRTTDDPLAKHQDALEGQFAQGSGGAGAGSD